MRIKQMSYAGFWKRFAANFIDAIIMIIVAFIVGFVMIVGGLVNNRDDLDTVEFVGNILGIILGWLYFAGMESSSTQATFGKMSLGIKVTDLEGDRISFGRATGRYFSKIISAIVLMIGFIMIAFTAKKQGLHDIIASCLVVNK
jgi:uncharacterized RDD family membrane protein YckC